MDDGKIRGKALRRVVVLALLGAMILAGAAFGWLAQTPPRYRAQMQVALLPSPRVPAERIADYWEALSRGQAGRIAAEVLAQRRWQGPAAEAARVPAASLEITAGVVADTSLIDVGVVAGTPRAAEAAAAAVVLEATPVVEQVSGPFTLQVVQGADGSATYVGAPAVQVYAVAAGAGLLVGGGFGLHLARRRRSRPVPAEDDVVSVEEAPIRDEPAADVPVQAASPAPREPEPRTERNDQVERPAPAPRQGIPAGAVHPVRAPRPTPGPNKHPHPAPAPSSERAPAPVPGPIRPAPQTPPNPDSQGRRESSPASPTARLEHSGVPGKGPGTGGPQGNAPHKEVNGSGGAYDGPRPPRR